jgi:hypothetical protein
MHPNLEWERIRLVIRVGEWRVMGGGSAGGCGRLGGIPVTEEVAGVFDLG